MLEINKIHLGDSFELLHEIEEKSIDLIVTDPPYAVGMTSNGTRGNLSDMNLVKPFYDGIFRRLYMAKAEEELRKKYRVKEIIAKLREKGII